MDSTTKVCTMCGESKPATLEFFSRNGRKPLGLESRCKVCTSQFRRARLEADPEGERAKKRAFYARNPEKYRGHIYEYRRRYPERVKAQMREYRQRITPEQREKAREHVRRWRREHPDRSRALAVSWAARNPDAKLAIIHARRARKTGVGGRHTAADVRAQYARQDGRCWWCGTRVGDKYHVDHIVPLARGGTNAASNICVSCPGCNLQKSAKLPIEFAGRLF